jgi:hypothetical protein
MRRNILLLALTCLAACFVEEPEPDTCGAVGLMGLIGQDVSALEGREARVIPPGALITKDHRIERLNADLDDASRITRLWCG